MATTAFVSEDELRAAAPNLDLSRYTSPTISGMLVTATNRAENFLDYSLAYEGARVEKLRGLVSPDGDIWIFPNKRPVLGLNSATITKGSFTSDLTLSGGGKNYYDIIDDSKIVIAASQVSLSQVSIINYQALRQGTFFMQVSYSCGYQSYDRPKDIVDAVLLYARDIFARDQNTAGASEISQGSVTIKYADIKGKSDFVKDAEDILLNYKPVTGF